MSDLGERKLDADPYGFTWGPMEVHRLVWVEGRGRVLSVKTDYDEVQILVSEKGRRIRVWHGSTELTA